MKFIYGKYQYSNFVKTHRANNLAELKNILDTAYKSENYFLGYVKYCDLKNNDIKDLAQFSEFRNKEIFKSPQSPHSFAPKIKSNLNLKKYKQKIKAIKKLIAKGECYQINFTHRLKIKSFAKSKNIFYQLLRQQNTTYKAFMKFDNCKILSFSPELFFRLKNNTISVRPMKGTIKRGKNNAQDKEFQEFLKNDVKNISENLMIVDLFRNDLNKFASNLETKLFNIEKYKSLFQMTSSIRAKTEAKLSDIFESIFPSGSITGAPKQSVIENIKKLEDEKRQIYCGALGVISKNLAIFSIPIRTLVKYKNDDFYSYGVGSGVVWDSEYKNEYKELALKTKFLRALEKDFFIFETCLLEKGEIFLKKLHFKRLKKAAKHFNIKLNLKELEKIETKNNDQMILKIKVYIDGSISTELIPLDSIKSTKVILKKQNFLSDFALFKTQNRSHLDSKKIQDGEIFDYLYFDKNKRLLEGSRSNIVLQIEGILYTPKLKNVAFLNGTFRQYLLKKNKIFEKKLFLKDIKRAEKIFCINSVRRFVEVKINAR